MNNEKIKLFYSDSFLCNKCKTIDKKLQLINNKHYSKHFLDIYSLFHIVGGIILGLMFNNIYYVIIIAILFEIWENSFLGVSFWLGIHFSDHLEYDSYINIIGDLLCSIVGFYITKLGVDISIKIGIALTVIATLTSKILIP
jgi:hypothetical protein